MFAHTQKPAKSICSPVRSAPWINRNRCYEDKSILPCPTSLSNHETARPTEHDLQRSPGLPSDQIPQKITEPQFAYNFSQIPLFPRQPENIQENLAVKSSGDISEQETHRIADRVMRMTEPDIIQQQGVGCETNELQFQNKPKNQIYPFADQAIQRHIDKPLRQIQPRSRSEKTVASGLYPSCRSLPIWLQIDLGWHNSPPDTGPGSRSEPLVQQGTSSTQLVRSMSTDAWYRSPVNPNNPVLVWTDGTNLFFGPSNAAITAGRTALPDASFSPLPGYNAVEIWWDRTIGLVDPGPFIVIARNIADPQAQDLEVMVNEDLQQSASFSGILGSGQSVRYVTRENVEFLSDDNQTVPPELSGAPQNSAIHGISFPDGFLRYRSGSGSDDLYVAQGANTAAYLVERSSGTVREQFSAGSVSAVVPATSGVVGIEITTGATGTTETASIDLSASPPTITRTAGHTISDPGYPAARARLEGMGVVIEEHGVRFRVAELDAVENALTLGNDRGIDALVAYQAQPTHRRQSLLRLEKILGPRDCRGSFSYPLGPTLIIQTPFDMQSDQQRSTVRHEMTHIIMGVINEARPAGQMSVSAQRGRSQEIAGNIRLGERGAGDPAAVPASEQIWRGNYVIGNDPEMADIFIDLLATHTFITDPEGTGDQRGVALADESRYSTAPARSGHPSEGVGEFVASFVTSATVFRPQFEAAVLEAERAGNASGASAGTELRSLYQRAWTRIDTVYVPLGPNPF